MYLIFHQKQINIKNVIFITVLNSSYCKCKKGYYVAIISTIAEIANQIEEIQPTMNIIGASLEQFDKISDIYHSIDTSFNRNIYIILSFVLQSQFENGTDNGIEIYEKITGFKLSLNFKEEGEKKFKK